MDRPSASSEKTPLMPPYFYSTVTNRTYRKRLRTFQCTACIMITMIVITMFLLTIIQNINQTSTALSTPNKLKLSLERFPFLKKTLPLTKRPPRDWAENIPTKEELMDAIKKGKYELKKRRKLENQLEPLESDTPASRAQRSVATAASVKPLAEAAYVVEEATLALINSSNMLIENNVGEGPSTVGFIDVPPYCMLRATPCPKTKYRSQDGSCNNLEHPLKWGVSNIPYRRTLPSHYGDGISLPRVGMNGDQLPSARDVSLTVHRPSYSSDSTFTVMLAVWGQFIDHDVTSLALSKGSNSSAIKCCNVDGPVHPECFPVELDVEDPFFSEHNLTCMEFVRSAPAHSCHFGPREQLNQATSFIDASAVYGNTETKTSKLRNGVHGQLRMLKFGNREMLPLSKDPDDGCNSIEMTAQGKYCFESGDERANENLHLTTMHLIWARQHNRVAGELRRLRPEWSDSTIFEETRRVVSAQMQHITYSEFLPVILGHDVMYALEMHPLEKGYSDAYDPTVDPSIANHFASAAFRFAHTLLPHKGAVRSLLATTDAHKHLRKGYVEALPSFILTGYSQTALKTPAYIIADGIGIGPKIEGVPMKPAYCNEDPVPCPLSKYRTQDGTCNNLQHPLLWGVSNTPFRRAETPWYGDGVSSPRIPKRTPVLPSARDVSVTVHRPSYGPDSDFTVMLAVWGQFIDHDITATALSKGANNTAIKCCDKSQPPHPECYPVELDVEDPFYQNYNLTCMEFVRSAPALTCNYGPREQLNQATTFLDASTVYGSNEVKTLQLRTGITGQLKMLNDGYRELLPPSTDPNDGCNTVAMNAQGRYCFQSGDERANENLHLTTMHLIWARQHNRVAAELHRLNPTWPDNMVFEETRRILGAQMQHITYAEFLPAILGADVMFALNLTLKTEGYSDAYDPTVDPSIANHFSAAAFRFAHTLLPGLIRNTDTSTGTVNYIHLHQMLFNPYALYNKKGSQIAMSSAMNTPVHAVHPHVTSELSEHLFERPIVLNGTTTTSEPVTKPGPCGLDLVSLNIQRGRDHGLPPYRVWRQHCGQSRPYDYNDLEDVFDDLSFARIKEIYDHVDDIDLYTGALAEKPRGRLLGPTFTCLISDQFLRLKVGDRYWYETSDPTVGFTPQQLQEIRKTTLAGVICANEVLLDKAQPKVMETLSATNPLVDCKELPQPSFDPWKEPPSSTTPPKSEA